MSIQGNHEHRGEDAFIKAQFEIARLKAEVEELKSQPDPLTAYLYADTLRRDDIKTLKAHIERLTKAGDYLATNIPRMVTCRVDAVEATHLMEVWNAAKEGKPHA